MYKVFNLKTKEIFEDVISIDHNNKTFTWIDDDYSNINKESIEISLENCDYVKQLGVDINGQKIYENDYVFVVAKGVDSGEFNIIDNGGEFSKLNNSNHKYIKNNQLDSNYDYNLMRSHSPLDNIDIVSNSHGYDDVRQLRSRLRIGAMGTGRSELSESIDSLLNIRSDILNNNATGHVNMDIPPIYQNLNDRLDILRNNGSDYSDMDITSLYPSLNTQFNNNDIDQIRLKWL